MLLECMAKEWPSFVKSMDDWTGSTLPRLYERSEAVATLFDALDLASVEVLRAESRLAQDTAAARRMLRGHEFVLLDSVEACLIEQDLHDEVVEQDLAAFRSMVARRYPGTLLRLRWTRVDLRSLIDSAPLEDEARRAFEGAVCDAETTTSASV